MALPSTTLDSKLRCSIKSKSYTNRSSGVAKGGPEWAFAQPSVICAQWRSQARGDGGADSADMHTPQTLDNVNEHTKG